VANQLLTRNSLFHVHAVRTWLASASPIESERGEFSGKRQANVSFARLFSVREPTIANPQELYVESRRNRIHPVINREAHATRTRFSFRASDGFIT
jgi:hypothetical protein